jgi:uncharacterized oligopeptide transporter (OPT) family protein
LLARDINHRLWGAVPVSSGLIAGESLMGVAVALWLAGVFG